MRVLGTRFLLTLFTLLFVVSAWAYKPGPEVIRECPKCKVKLVEQTMMSGNTFGARIWTDGKMLARWLPDQPWLVKCPKCGIVFWIDEAKKLGEQSPWDGDKKKRPKAVKPNLPTESDFLHMLVKGSLTKEKELYVRRTAWWLANDAVRTNAEAEVNYSPEQSANLRSLANFLDEKDPNQRIMKAEVYRELGQFQECTELLSNSFENEHHGRVANFIRELAVQNIRAVREIPKEEESGKPGGRDGM